MIRVASLTEGKHVPSSRFRIRQHIETLAQYGVEVKDFPQPFSNDQWQRILPKKLRIRHMPFIWPLIPAISALQLTTLIKKVMACRKYDLIWLSRGLYPGYPSFEFLLKKPLLLDVDDAIWLNKPYGLAQAKCVALRADRILVGNNYLAEWFGQYNSNVFNVPTAVDTERFFPTFRGDGVPFTLGWTGVSSNFRYLYAINDALKEFFRFAPDARLLIVSDLPPKEISAPAEKIRYVSWTEHNEASMVQQMDVGLMPLGDDSWARGKCSFKMLQYMSCGIPVIVSPVGMNVEVLAKADFGFAPRDTSEWFDSLMYLYKNRQVISVLGQAARDVITTHYSRRVVSERISNIIKDMT